MLLTRTDSNGDTPQRLVRHLLSRRTHGTYWSSTRDTALCIEALGEFLRTIGEVRPAMDVELWLDGEKRKRVSVTSRNLFLSDTSFAFGGDAVRPGKHRLEFRRDGVGSLHFGGRVANAAPAESNPASSGPRISISRKYYLLGPGGKTHHTATSGDEPASPRPDGYNRREITDLATVNRGDLVEVEFEINSKNDCEYLVLEDMNPAGFAPVNVRSGYTDSGLQAYKEMHENRVRFFVSNVDQGVHRVRYRMRATFAGHYSALPAYIHAMYTPQLEARSGTIRFNVVD
jgi:hypothetical protein